MHKRSSQRKRTPKGLSAAARQAIDDHYANPCPELSARHPEIAERLGVLERYWVATQDLPVRKAAKVVGSAGGLLEAPDRVFTETRLKRRWVHKERNIHSYMNPSTEDAASNALLDIWHTPSADGAMAGVKEFVDLFGDRYPKATKCLLDDLPELLAFYRLPCDTLGVDPHDQPHRVGVLDHPQPRQAHLRSHEPAGHRRDGLQARHRGAEAMATHQRLLAARQCLRVLPVQGRPPGATREPARSSRRATDRLLLRTQHSILACQKILPR